MRRRLAALLACASALGVAAAPADARRSPDLWATVNICDTANHPDRMGVRARIPGNGTSQQMWMRFHAYWFDEEARRWRPIGRAATSRWIRLGHARVRSREKGYTFSFEPPAAGSRFVIRGVVDYQWRGYSRRTRRWRVIRRERLNTRTRSARVRGADPPGFSSGLCEIT